MELSYSVYVALHIMSTTIVLLLLILCQLQKFRYATRNALRNLTLCMLFLQVFATLYYCSLQLASQGSADIPPQVISGLFMGLYVLSYLSIAAFHRYVLLYARLVNNSENPRWLNLLPLPLGVVVIGLFLTSVPWPWLYSFDPLGRPQLTPLYAICQVLLALLLLIDAGLVLRRTKTVPPTVIAAFLAFMLWPLAGIILHALFGLDLGYVMAAFSLMIMYAFMDTRMGLHIVEQERQLALRQAQLQSQQAQIMLSQIRPHFLHNAISSIMLLCKRDPAAASDALADFADYLRANLDSLSRTELVPFAAELDHVQTYVRLELLRFPDKLTFKCQAAPTTFLLPPLTVQPLVENAIKHGVGTKDEGGMVELRVWEQPDAFVIQVRDNGVGFDPAAVAVDDDRSHVGLQSVQARLATMCNGTLDIDSTLNVGTVATITIPKEVPS